jgi:hypothetical protein
MMIGNNFLSTSEWRERFRAIVVSIFTKNHGGRQEARIRVSETHDGDVQDFKKGRRGISNYGFQCQ